ncbi:putative glycosyltransferase, DXD sugar-binding, alpha 1,4-glycosyltransferase [Helianthus annuus]|uniref:Glycosyltransferase, DXD sugar-binding, alpha 1,4-glycosyltransferase n=1 Tax=Helianthus annuus TaxID=4232 RepID=A0A251S491_HELAN|nr:lactosylceramide 4-alpha-galactosyltransferase [Helianthus annuus]KAF5762627.1 putative glycosyltransferase, DXD sugar-binding, alpha 1,4-glycosyltransferase [Helianthus annuus]KAJ0449652.1 putative glycosyltransferase, DXD sugar-binding, alpha 1,4-glycosyltransferase [Helianthus annuus]KAJ0453400.1 putative glycosyltransferase, DXD sugar-binding, alpha 1,4-glycosyltransferase [Helianthus annuus]KAJ0471358.1 putative glycosyltransferase, DXD sugar-binding, alpha 1,4-glycosyltransferase [Heli
MKTTVLPSEQQRRSLNRHTKFRIFTTISLLAIIFTYMFNTNTFISFNFNPAIFTNHKLIINYNQLIIQESHNSPLNLKFDILNSNPKFETRANEFLKDCKLRFFMTWISSPSILFGERELLVVEALFKSNPDSCLIIISNNMDSDHGFQLLKPVINLGFRVQAIEPDFHFLFKNTPAESWFGCIQNRKCDPGEIPLAQNLSNLIRLVALYKFGGVYLDTDFIPLNNFSGLRNSIGAQSANRFGNWTRLNNAVLVFDKNHPLLYKFIEEFALTFNGNRWGFNGPYLVSRVVKRNMEYNLSVLPPAAFYPVGWGRIGGLFRRPVDRGHRRWVEAKVVQLKESSYGVHLWNKQSRKLRIEEESILARLISHHCVVCKTFNKSQRLR